MGYFDGKVAIITGAGRNIGRETAKIMASEGARIVVNDLGGGPQGVGSDVSLAQQVVDEIKASGGEAVAETSSVASMVGGQAVVDCAMDNFGRLDFIINNAGIIRPRPITTMSEEDFDLVLAVNLKGYFATIRAGVEHIKKQGGAIVNLSSPSGLGHYGMANYSAAKEGVVGMTRTIARELAEHDIGVFAVRPMAGGSNMNIPEVLETIRYQIEELKIPYISNQWLMSHGVDSKPAHVASVLAWLCTSQAKTLTGREIYIVGGHIALMQEPDLTRSQFNAQGWTLEALCDPQISTALTYDTRNRYTGK